MMSQPRHIIRLVRHIKWSLFGEVTLLRKSVIRRCILVGGGGGRGQVGLCKTFATTTKLLANALSSPHMILYWIYWISQSEMVHDWETYCEYEGERELDLWIFHKTSAGVQTKVLHNFQYDIVFFIRNEFNIHVHDIMILIIRMDALWPSPYNWMKPNRLSALMFICYETSFSLLLNDFFPPKSFNLAIFQTFSILVQNHESTRSAARKDFFWNRFSRNKKAADRTQPIWGHLGRRTIPRGEWCCS